jgi:spore photoproduct lyase
MTKLIKKINRKSMLIRPSGRSTDFISPSFGYGCLYDCSYCYMKRHKPKGLDIAENIEDILTTVNNHAYFTPVDKPNQTHPVLTTYDISCNEDFALHAKNHPLAMGSFATKYVNPDFISYDPNKKVRIRYSLMPQHMSDKHEPNTSKILDRIKAVDAFIDAGYEVHLNFSPVIVYKGWRKDYKELFEMVNEYIDYKDEVLAEVIFLTHNKKKHLANLKNHAEAEKDLWIPEIQQNKISQYGGENLRYELSLKKKFIEQFTAIHDSIIPWNKIRYIF